MSLNPYTYQALVVKQGLMFYMKFKQPLNRGYTPKNLMNTASHITGHKFKARDYQGAIDALTTWLEERV